MRKLIQAAIWIDQQHRYMNYLIEPIIKPEHDDTLLSEARQQPGSVSHSLQF